MRGRATDRVRRRARTAQRDPARKMSAPAGDDVVRRTGPVDGRSTRPRHRSTVGPMVFRGSEAVAAGLLTRGQLRGPSVKRLFRDVYVDGRTTVTHEVRCRGATLALPAD